MSFLVFSSGGYQERGGRQTTIRRKGKRKMTKMTTTTRSRQPPRRRNRSSWSRTMKSLSRRRPPSRSLPLSLQLCFVPTSQSKEDNCRSAGEVQLTYTMTLTIPWMRLTSLMWHLSWGMTKTLMKFCCQVPHLNPFLTLLLTSPVSAKIHLCHLPLPPLPLFPPLPDRVRVTLRQRVTILHSQTESVLQFPNVRNYAW